MMNTQTSNREEKIKEAYQLIEEGIHKITSAEQFKEFLRFSAKFHQYSFQNQMLIWLQKPTATFVAGYQTWKKKFNRHVKKGEKGIKILAPIKFTKKKANEDGEEVEKDILLFRVTTVFDISQTEGKPVPTIGQFVQSLTGETDLYDKMKAICPFPIRELEDCHGADGYFHLKERYIAIHTPQSSKQKLLTLIHEMAHGMLHGDPKEAPSKTVRELEAESTAFVVCHALGIDSSINSIGYLTAYGQTKAIELINQSKERINKTVKKILSDFEKAYLSVTNEEVEEETAIS